MLRLRTYVWVLIFWVILLLVAGCSMVVTTYSIRDNDVIVGEESDIVESSHLDKLIDKVLRLNKQEVGDDCG